MKILIILIGLLIAGPAFAQEAYVNPIDGKAYIADWKVYKPEGKAETQKGRVVNAGVRLLNTQEDFKRNATVEDLAKLISYTHDMLAKEVGPTKEPGQIMLQISLNKDKSPDFEMSYQGNLNPDMLQRFYSNLEKIEFNTKESTVTLEVHFIIKSA